MSRSNFPNGFAQGVTIRGLPLLQVHPGEVFYVNNSSVLSKGGVGGSNGNDGSYRRPFSTLAYALTKCTANRGDIIAVMPGHAESISASDLALNVAGVAVVGLGAGALRPTFTFSAAGSTIAVSAGQVSLSNLRLLAPIANTTAGITLTGADFTMDNCLMQSSLAAGSFNIAILTAAASDGMYVVDSVFNAEHTSGGLAVTDVPTEAIRLVGCDNSVIKGNFIVGNYSTAAINGITTESEAILITDNQIHNIDAAAAAGGIDLVAACTGMVSQNMIGAYETTAIATTIDNSSCSNCGNLVTNAVAEVGGIPGTESG